MIDDCLLVSSLHHTLQLNDPLPRMISATSPLPYPNRLSLFNSTPPFSIGVFSSFPSGFGSRLSFRSASLPPAAAPWRMECVKNLGFRFFAGSNGQVVKVEHDSVGEDVFDPAAAEARVPPDHLVIMVNGIVGSSEDWKYAAEQFVRKLPDKVIVHRSECNYSKLTFDGVDMMGERLAKEVLAVVKNKPQVRRISFVAHSLGGLVARYAVARLYQQSPKLDLSSSSGKSLTKETLNSVPCRDQPSEARIAGLEPMNFITVATPHLGSRGNKQLPFLCGLPFLERRASQTAHLIVGRTGNHLFLTDNDNGKPPLLLQMVNDSDDLRFISALRAFKRRVAYANANFDHMVGWRTSSIRRQNELPKSGALGVSHRDSARHLQKWRHRHAKPNLLVTDEKYPHIVYVEQQQTERTCNRASTVIRDQATDLEEEMIKGLTQVSWERVDVSFHKSRQRYIAHSTIQVKTYWFNSDGADVVFHMIDNFLL